MLQIGIGVSIIVGLVYLGVRAVRPLRQQPILDGLAAGACRRLSPSGHNQHFTVFLDPGHGSPDPGTSGITPAGQPVREKDLALATATTLSTLLRAHGYTVVLSRTRDTSVAKLSPADAAAGAFSLDGNHADLEARVRCANAAHAQLLVSLHFNAFDDASVGGTETFYDDARPFSDQNAALAALVQDAVVHEIATAGWQVPDRGVALDSGEIAPALGDAAAAYHHLLVLGPALPGYLAQPSQMPGVLCEPLFLSNSEEAAIAASADGQAAIARGVANAIDAYVSYAHSSGRA